MKRPGIRTLALLCLQATIVTGQSPKPTEYQVKAAYLSNFGRFVEWPVGQPQDGNPVPFPVCVLGSDPFGKALDQALAGENIKGSPLVARRISRPQDASGCRILYIGSSEDGKLSSILAFLGEASILTVGDSPDFILHGGMIQFVLAANRVRFEVNLAAVQRVRMNLSSELTKLATVVRREP